MRAHRLISLAIALLLILFLLQGCNECYQTEDEIAFINNMQFESMSSEELLAKHHFELTYVEPDWPVYLPANIILTKKIIRGDTTYGLENETEYNSYITFLKNITLNKVKENKKDYFTQIKKAFLFFKNKDTDFCSLQTQQQYDTAMVYFMGWAPYNRIYLPNANGPIIIQSPHDELRLNIITKTDNPNVIAYSSMNLK